MEEFEGEPNRRYEMIVARLRDGCSVDSMHACFKCRSAATSQEEEEKDEILDGKSMAGPRVERGHSGA
jgi:hypothetical protein